MFMKSSFAIEAQEFYFYSFGKVLLLGKRKNAKDEEWNCVIWLSKELWGELAGSRNWKKNMLSTDSFDFLPSHVQTFFFFPKKRGYPFFIDTISELKGGQQDKKSIIIAIFSYNWPLLISLQTAYCQHSHRLIRSFFP